ncbi:MAG: DNA-binding protein [Clostridium sp.]|nr:DNA-binding protein [Clostridium sp.]
MDREHLIELIKNTTMDSTEVVNYLGVTKQRLSGMNKQGKLVAVKKGIYLKIDVENRKREQDELRKKYYRSTSKCKLK